jgi:hypothetical protein
MLHPDNSPTLGLSGCGPVAEKGINIEEIRTAVPQEDEQRGVIQHRPQLVSCISLEASI